MAGGVHAGQLSHLCAAVLSFGVTAEGQALGTEEAILQNPCQAGVHSVWLLSSPSSLQKETELC